MMSDNRGRFVSLGHHNIMSSVAFVPLDEASPTSFAALLGDAGGTRKVVNLKGYGSGLQGTAYHKEVVQAIGDADGSSRAAVVAADRVQTGWEATPRHL